MQIDHELYEEMTAHFIQQLSLPPLAAKIYALLLFDFSGEGLTFDDFVEQLQASKSSVSNSLNLLVQNSHLKVFNKIQDRKRYYRINVENTQNRYNQILQQWNYELSIINRLDAHMEKIGVKNDAIKEKLAVYQEMLSNFINTMEQSIAKITNYHTK
jgi:DNA-binding transcriptional regulator GbsR (MarR family)